MSSWVPFSRARAVSQQAFYARRGVSAFGVGAVPWRLSTGRSMATVVRTAALQWARARGKPGVKVVDLGAGTGRLGFHLVAPGIRVALCEQSAAMTEAWRAHPQLAGCEVHAVDALDDASLAAALSVHSDEALVVVGTYLFDSLAHELVRVTPDGVEQGGEEDGGRSFRTTSELDLRCRALRAEGTYFAPVGALACIEAVERAAGGPALFMFADKGPCTWAEALESDTLRVADHSGAWSVAVNFPLLREWVAPRKWHEHPGNVDAFVIAAVELNVPAQPPAVAATGPEVELEDALAALSHDEAGAILRFIEAQAELRKPLFTAEHPLAHQRAVTEARASKEEAPVLRLEPDSDALLELSDALRALAPQASGELLAWVERAASETFVAAADDVAFHAATVFHRARQLERADHWYSISLDRAGPHATTFFNRAVCRVERGAFVEAAADLDRVLELEPSHVRGLELRAALSAAAE